MVKPRVKVMHGVFAGLTGVLLYSYVVDGKCWFHIDMSEESGYMRCVIDVDEELISFTGAPF